MSEARSFGPPAERIAHRARAVLVSARRTKKMRTPLSPSRVIVLGHSELARLQWSQLPRHRLLFGE